MLYKAGGAVRRLDLVNIAFNRDKKIYDLINKMIELNLLNIEGKRDSVIGLTSISLSILRGERVKNSIKISQFTSNSLDKAEFMMRCNCNDILVRNEVKSALDAFRKKYQDHSRVDDLSKACLQTLNSCKDNNIFISSDLKTLVVYALNEVDFYKKIDNIGSIKYKIKHLRFDIERIILPVGNFENKIDIKSFIDNYRYNQSICYNKDIFNNISIEYI